MTKSAGERAFGHPRSKAPHPAYSNLSAKGREVSLRC